MKYKHIIAGIGSREVPMSHYDMMKSYAERLVRLGFILQSGGARKKKGAGNDVFSADELFEDVWNEHKGEGCIITETTTKQYKLQKKQKVWSMKCITPSNPAMGWAEDFYRKHNIIGHWAKLSDYAKLLHLRNFWQIRYFFGGHFDNSQNVNFVVCYSPLDNKGEPTGGTRTGIRVAQVLGIDVYNLAKPADQWKLEYMVTKIEEQVYGEGQTFEEIHQKDLGN